MAEYEKSIELRHIEAKIDEFVKSITPAGQRLMIEHRTPLWVLDLSLCCDGTDFTMGYYCGLKPDHKNRCHSFNKDVTFSRKN